MTTSNNEINESLIGFFFKFIKTKFQNMAAHALELILSRQLADTLSIPVFIVDPIGNLIFYNEPAEEILGKRFDETGAMPVEEWSTAFEPQDDKGDVIPPEELPLVHTLTEHEPAHKTFRIKNLKGKMFTISVTSLPIIGRSREFSGAMAIFWTKKSKV